MKSLFLILIFSLFGAASLAADLTPIDMTVGQQVRIAHVLVTCGPGQAQLPGGCNAYGCWKNGGGCNGYGCWNAPTGSCNGYGCTDNGECNGYGCPK